jgi:hypothetical protein
VVVFGVAFDVDGGAVELLSPQFLYLLDLVFEVAVLLLEEHVLELVVEVFLTVLGGDAEGVAVEREGVGVCQLLCFQQPCFGLLVCFDYSQILGHLSGVDGYGFVVDDAFLY